VKLVRGITGVVLAILVLIAIYYISSGPFVEHKREQTTPKKEKGDLPKGTSCIERREQRMMPIEGERPPATEIKIAIIIDDIGFDLPSVRELLTIDAPIAFAVLPHAPYSAAAAEMLYGAGREILLHLPMEPHDPGKNPGPGALFCWMGEAEIKQQVEEDIAAVPHVIGANNHMGSAFMEDEEKLAVAFGELKKRGLFFIDSRTTPHSRAEELAIRTGIRFAARKVFIDNEQDREITVKSLLGHTEKNSGNRMIMIGHPYPSTVLALKEAVSILKARGIAIASPTEMVKIIYRAETSNKKD
jgi:hypothetical protein